MKKKENMFGMNAGEEMNGVPDLSLRFHHTAEIISKKKKPKWHKPNPGLGVLNKVKKVKNERT